MLRRVGRALLKLVPARVQTFFRARFADAPPSELTGYLVWSAMGIVIGVPEIWAALSGDDFYWPTISTTVGHLQDRWPVLTLIPVALIVGYGYSALRIKPATTTLQADMTALTRTAQGRLTKQDLTLQQLAEGTPPPTGRPQVSATPYFALATVVVIAAALLASPSDNRFLVGYILYSLIAIFWVIIPNLAAYTLKRDIPFTTLVATINCLARRLALAAAIGAALLVILLIHLAFYPWPSRR
jgi:hypothetical protein